MLRQTLERHRSDLLPLAGFVAFFCLVFEAALFRDHLLLIGDPLRQLYPLRYTAWEMIRGGSLPLWSPFILGGYPTAAMVMLGITYPITWGYLFIKGPWAEQLYILAPYLLAPLFTYAFLRQLGRSRVASFLGGLSFGYGGFLFSPIGLTGVHANSALWLPLHLLGIARARNGSLLPPLLLSTFAYAMSILAGSGQMFLYGGALAIAYACWIGFVPDEVSRHRSWRPVAVAAGSIVLAAGLCAYQIFETWIATRLSVRRSYPIERVAEGSFEPGFAWRSLIQPAGNFWDSSTYLPLLTIALAIIATGAALRQPRRSTQTLFWVVAAAAAWVFILGIHTPLFAAYVKLPFVSRFRYPSRHSLEWTFAISVLGAYGWDLADSWIRKTRRATITALAGTSMAAVAAIIAVFWSSDVARRNLGQIFDLNNALKGLDLRYVVTKAAFTAAALIAVGLFSRMEESRLRATMLMAIVMLSTFVEPYMWIVRPIAIPWSMKSEYFNTLSATTRFIRSQSGPHDRTFSLPHPYVVDPVPAREVDAVNWTALGGLEDINGYESLIFERHSRALRSDPSQDAEPFILPSGRLLDLDNHVLDVLNVRFVTSYPDFQASPRGRMEKDGIVFFSDDVAIDLPRFKAVTLTATGAEADTIAIVSQMAFSETIEQDAPVARITVYDTSGRFVEQYLRAGSHTAEWSHERPELKATIRHSLAPVFDSSSADPTFQAHRFIGRIALGQRLRVDRIEIVNMTADASVGLWKASLYDSASRQSHPLPQPASSRWELVRDSSGVHVLKNLRARPRVWLVANVEVASKGEILKRLQGKSDTPFDPATTALVEEKLGQELSAPCETPCDAEIVSREPNRIVVRTNSASPALLVVSEMHYPGWVATVDGADEPIHQTDLLIRGVLVPAGKHEVVMSFRPRGTIAGAIVSLATLIGIYAAIVFERRRKKRAADSAGEPLQLT